MLEQAPLSRHAFHNWRLDQGIEGFHHGKPNGSFHEDVESSAKVFGLLFYILRPFVA